MTTKGIVFNPEITPTGTMSTVEINGVVYSVPKQEAANAVYQHQPIRRSRILLRPPAHRWQAERGDTDETPNPGGPGAQGWQGIPGVGGVNESSLRVLAFGNYYALLTAIYVPTDTELSGSRYVLKTGWTRLSFEASAVAIGYNIGRKSFSVPGYQSYKYTLAIAERPNPGAYVEAAVTWRDKPIDTTTPLVASSYGHNQLEFDDIINPDGSKNIPISEGSPRIISSGATGITLRADRFSQNNVVKPEADDARTWKLISRVYTSLSFLALYDNGTKYVPKVATAIPVAPLPAPPVIISAPIPAPCMPCDEVETPKLNPINPLNPVNPVSPPKQKRIVSKKPIRKQLPDNNDEEVVVDEFFEEDPNPILLVLCSSRPSSNRFQWRGLKNELTGTYEGQPNIYGYVLQQASDFKGQKYFKTSFLKDSGVAAFEFGGDSGHVELRYDAEFRHLYAYRRNIPFGVDVYITTIIMSNVSHRGFVNGFVNSQPGSGLPIPLSSSAWDSVFPSGYVPDTNNDFVFITRKTDQTSEPDCLFTYVRAANFDDTSKYITPEPDGLDSEYKKLNRSSWHGINQIDVGQIGLKDPDYLYHKGRTVPDFYLRKNGPNAAVEFTNYSDHPSTIHTYTMPKTQLIVEKRLNYKFLVNYQFGSSQVLEGPFKKVSDHQYNEEDVLLIDIDNSNAGVSDVLSKDGYMIMGARQSGSIIARFADIYKYGTLNIDPFNPFKQPRSAIDNIDDNLGNYQRLKIRASAIQTCGRTYGYGRPNRVVADYDPVGDGRMVACARSKSGGTLYIHTGSLSTQQVTYNVDNDGDFSRVRFNESAYYSTVRVYKLGSSSLT